MDSDRDQDGLWLAEAPNTTSAPPRTGGWIYAFDTVEFLWPKLLPKSGEPDPGWTPAERLVALVLAGHMGKKDDHGHPTCFVAQSTLAHEAGLSIRQVSRITKALTEGKRPESTGGVLPLFARSLSGRNCYTYTLVKDPVAFVARRNEARADEEKAWRSDQRPKLALQKRLLDGQITQSEYERKLAELRKEFRRARAS